MSPGAASLPPVGRPHKPRYRTYVFGVGLLALVSGLAGTLLVRAQSAPAAAGSPGTQSDGSTLLPSGWLVAPVGRHLKVGDLPLNAIQSPDSRYLIVTNNGLGQPSFSVIDVANWVVKNTTPLDSVWYGL